MMGSKKNVARFSKQAVVANRSENDLPGQRHQLELPERKDLALLRETEPETDRPCH